MVFASVVIIAEKRNHRLVVVQIFASDLPQYRGWFLKINSDNHFAIFAGWCVHDNGFYYYYNEANATNIVVVYLFNKVLCFDM
jgi:hypothetical protein